MIEKSTTRFLNQPFKNHHNFTILVTLSFLVVATFGMIHHEMWRDEFQAWMIARDSQTLTDLFKNLRYEGHPALWHIGLYILSRFTHNPIAMQLFHLAIASGIIYLFVRFSPFTRLQKVLFAFGYFPLYEYGIISRNYNLGVLLLILFCIFFETRYQSYLILSVILALLANTNAFTFIVAFTLGLTLIFEIIIDRFTERSLTIKKWNFLVSISIYALGAILAVIQLLPPSDSNFTGDETQVFQTSTSETKLVDLERIARTIGRIWKIYVPIPNVFQYDLWGSNFLTDGPAFLQVLSILFAVVLLIISTALFLKKPVILFMYLSTTLGILLFHYTKFIGSVRHSGYLFFLLLACLWLSNNTQSVSLSFNRSLEKIANLLNRYQKPYINTLLCLHVIAAVLMYSADLKYPFSASAEVVGIIEKHSLNNMPIIGSQDLPVSSIAALLDQKIYYPESQRFGTFIKWNERKLVKQPEVVAQTHQLLIQQNIPQALLILDRELDRSKVERPDLNIAALYHSRRSIAPDESYHLYRVTRKPNTRTSNSHQSTDTPTHDS